MLNVQRASITVNKDAEVVTQTLFGREYTVFPVIAMVEGVRLGAAQDSPELGLASEFGDAPAAWANRPLVLNHPKVDGNFVSANSPSVLEDWAFGLTMNPYVEDGKLKMEAWIDNERVTTLGGEYEEVLDALKSGDETIEVSVGFFSNVEKKKGKFNGQSYSGIWRNIKPDHLAILSKGTLGACSIEDGCGVPRINQEGDMAAELKTNCSCQDKTTTQEEETSENPVVAFEQAEAEARKDIRELNTKLVEQSIAADILDRDASKVIANALQRKYGSYIYIYGISRDYAVFEKYDYSCSPSMYKTYKIGVNLSSEGGVSFVGEPAEVILLTKVVEVSEDTSTSFSLNSTKENDMSGEPKEPTAPVVTQEEKPVVTAPVVQTTPPAKMTIQEFMAAAPDELREVLQEGMEARTQRKTSAISAIKANSANTFTDAWLEGQSIAVLEGMAKMAAPNYSGRATPVAPVVNEAAATVPVVRAFTPKSAA